MEPNRPGTTRRGFLRSAGIAAAAAAAPAIIPAGALGRGTRPAPSNRVTLGVIGCGGMGRTDLQNFLALPDVEVLAVCDVDSFHREVALEIVARHEKEKLGREKSSCAAYNEFERVLERDDIDAVLIATPDHWHAGIAIEAAKAGKDIYGEKPLSRTINEGKNMIRAVQRYGRVFQMGTQTRSHPPVQRVINLIRAGVIGQVRRVEVKNPLYGGGPIYQPKPVPEGFDYDRWLGPAPWAPYQPERCHGFFRVVMDYSGGVVTDHGTHRLDVAQWGSGHEHTGPVRVEGWGKRPADGLYDAFTQMEVTFTFADGCTYVFTAEADIMNWGVTFHGDEGWIRIPMEAPLPHLPITASDPRILTIKLPPSQQVVYPSDNHWANFIQCVRSRSTPAQNIETGHRSTILCHLANAVMELGRPVEWDPDRQEFVNDPVAMLKMDRPKREPWARFFEI